MLTGLRERDKREKSEEKIDCHHQDSNQGPSLVASDALTTAGADPGGCEGCK